MINGLFLTLFGIAAPAFSQTAEPDRSETFHTSAGDFKLEWTIVGGTRSEVLVTPKNRHQLSPSCHPDGSCASDKDGNWTGVFPTNNSIRTVIDVDKKAYLVMSNGIWKWEPREDIFVEVYSAGYDHRIDICIDGGFCTLGPKSGGSAFLGVVFFDEEHCTWTTIEYNGEHMVSSRKIERNPNVPELFTITHYAWGDTTYLPRTTIVNTRTNSIEVQPLVEAPAPTPAAAEKKR